MRRRSLLLIAALLACQSPGGDGARPAASAGSDAAVAQVPVSTQLVGTAHPIHVLTSAANGRWVVACQARHDTDGAPGIAVKLTEEGGFRGDAMKLYLIRGGGDGGAIDGFVAASSDDRWVIVVRDRTLVLIDTVYDVDRVLADADVRGEASGSRMDAAFNAGNKYVVFARRVGDHSGVAIRDLATQGERELDLAGDTLWQVESECASAWLRLTRIRKSARPNDWPHLVTWVPAGVACRGLDPNMFELRSNAIGTAWLRPDTGELRDTRPPLPDEPARRDALAAFETRALTGASGSYRITDARTGAVTPLPGVAGDVGPQARHIVAIGTAIVDLARARVLGTVPREPLAVDVTGRALVPIADAGGEVARGPLCWIRPTLAGGAPPPRFAPP